MGCWLPAEQVRVQAGWLGVPYYTHYAGQVTLFVLVAMLLLQILLGWRQGKWYKTPAYTASLYLLGFTAHRIWLTQQSDGWVRPGYGAYLVLVGSALLLVFTMLYRHKAIPNLEA
ncbi:MAG TPA: hypothetical protein PKD90_14670 [Phnomibacter sp.]|nr:hypothetical protein [Phnomibacter sp.]